MQLCFRERFTTNYTNRASSLNFVGLRILAFIYSEVNPKSCDFLYTYCLIEKFLCVIFVRFRFAADEIEKLCSEVMAHPWKLIEEHWLFAMPLLHFLRGDSNPLEEPDIEGYYHRPEWFGAQNLKIKEFQRLATKM